MIVKPQVTKLKNNFSVITKQIDNVNSVAINIWINVGSRYESLDKIGISHFLEHMAFKGTNTRTALDIAKTFDQIGGNFNAQTDREHTVYHVKVLKKDINIAIEILADIIANSQFPEEEIEREKGVVLQEIYQTYDSPSSIIFDKYMETAFSNQIFGQSILGSVESVQNFSKEDINNYMRTHYHGNNMLISVAGDILHDDIVKLSSDFSHITTSQCSSVTPSVYTGGEYLEKKDLEQVNLLIGFPGVSYKDDRFYTMQVLDAILGGSMSSRLFQEIREKLGLVYSISSFNSSYSDNGIFSIYAATDKDNLQKLIIAITSEIKKTSINLTEEEIQRSKNKLISEILMSRESTTAYADALGYYYSHYNRYIARSEIIEHIHAVNIHQVKSAIHSLMQHYNKITLAAIGEIEYLPSYHDISLMLKP
ncbi:insulinase family protein [Neoehrlichia mikurensis]|uniref:Insulinase family protein n=1 Tax=Neoehrlichia mikurensis TaxID=89586 RepID=A0A9Q9BZ81_9RICK|nr:pitrilysin family protein [Neoehrlichia mikurensis]QXK91686.1 insulinase family protein [Neoehrlichia mikurensis]QXK92897.1 insulinase family protein [Neoehrlichia mikurensis]QXK93377.1 insulinase family protein [Neoehrlichia mikurensis]UTO55678.1 insulinase family protein [Neoehrlichia mikurensis]UTO56596.1 insulinase family protein [Neoehrlichia mikurensis]